MSRGGNHKDVTSVILSQDSRWILDRLKLALREVAKFDGEPTRSWLIAECIRFAYCYSPAFISSYMPGEQADEDKSSVEIGGHAEQAISPPTQEACQAGNSGIATNRVYDVRSDTQAGNGTHQADRPKRGRPRTRKTLP